MKYTKRFLALFLALCMMLTSVPLNVNATEGTPSEVATEAPAQDDDQTVTEEEPSETVDSENTESTEKDEEDSETVTSDEDVVIGADQSDSTTAKDSQDTTLDEAKPEKDKPDNAKPGKDKKEDLKPGKDKKEDLKTGKDKKTEAEEIIEEVPAIYASRDVAEEPVTYADTDGVVDAAIIFTDLHTSNSDYKENTIKGIFGALKNTGLEFSSVTSGGDAFSVNADNTKYTGKTKDISEDIRTALGKTDIPVNYVWSDHDRYAVKEDRNTLLDKTSHLVYGAGNDGEYGTEDDGNYYVYALSMGDLGSYDRYSSGFNSDARAGKGFTATVDLAIDNFEADAAKLKKDRPLFIVSHQPLFNRRNDNAFAEKWFDAINEVAEGMDVAFFFGHNHKYDQSGDYYYAKGSTMPVATADNWKSYETGQGNGGKPSVTLSARNKTLNFTHMCAGYMDPRSTGSYDSTTTRENTAVAITIYNDSINYKSVGAGSYYKGNHALNETVPRDHAVEQIKEVRFEDTILTIQAKALGLTEIEATNVTDQYNLGGHFTYHIAYDVELSGHEEGEAVAYSILFLDDMDDTIVELYHVDEEGNKTAIPYEMVTDDDGRRYLEFISTSTGCFVYGVPNVPDGYELSKIEVSNIVKDTYFVGESLDMVNQEVTAVYTKEGSSDVVRKLFIQGENVTDGYTVSGYDMTQPGKQTVVISYKDKTISFEITVKERGATDSATGVTVADVDNKITGLTVKTKEETVEGYSAYVVYDINPEGYVQGTEAEVTIPVDVNKFDVERPIEIIDKELGTTQNGYIEDGKVTFTTNHFSEYPIAQRAAGAAATVEGLVATSVNKKSTTTVEKNNYYLIKNNGNNLFLTGDKVINADRLVLDGDVNKPALAANNVWYFSNVKDNDYNIQYKSPSGQYLAIEYGTAKLEDTKHDLTIETQTGGGGFYEWTALDIAEKSYHLNNYGNSDQAAGYTDKATDNQGSRWSLYKVITEPAVLSVNESALGMYVGDAQNLTASVTVNDIDDTGATITWETSDENVVTVNDNGQVVAKGVGTAEITAILASVESGRLLAPARVTIPVQVNTLIEGTTIEITHKSTQQVVDRTLLVKNVEANTEYKLDYKVLVDGIAPETKPTDNIVWSSNDESIATVENGVVTFQGNEGIVRITVSYEYEENTHATDSVVISVSKDNYMIPSDGTNDFPEYPNEGSVRFDKTATAVGNFSETGIAQLELSMTGVPFTSGNKMDIVVMLDRSSSMPKATGANRINNTIAATEAFIKSIVKNEDGSFNGNRIVVYDFLGGNPAYAPNGTGTHAFQANRFTTDEEEGYQIINNDAELTALINALKDEKTGFIGQQSVYGTDYANGLKTCYEQLLNTQNDGNQQFCVFMSDGIPNAYQGETTYFDGTTTARSNNYTPKHGIVDMFTGTNSNTRDTDYEYEKYSTLMKNNGVSVYTVGLGLENKNSSWSGASATACLNVASILLNDISGPAKELKRDTGSALSKKDEYFFNVVDNSGSSLMVEAFENIAKKILEAAKNVKVTDKIADEYTMIFAIPEGTESDFVASRLPANQEFYIEFLNYTLKPVVEQGVITNYVRDKETSMMKLYLAKDKDGKYFAASNAAGAPFAAPTFAAVQEGQDGYYNLVDGVYEFTPNGTGAYNMVSGARVSGTTNDNLIIETPYVHYEAENKILVWTADKLSSSELVLRYFLYLNDSAAEGPDNQVEAGTYPTNDFATLEYTNFQGNDCQQIFPKPQMTWNGAQVSYVFYLVNKEGKPVNRAGRVVPFSEAVYVTDVFTYAVTWNRNDASAQLVEEYLATDKVPDVYELYDKYAGYNIYVYETENGVDRNNHFDIIGSSKEANTTYVFNTKSDVDKYKNPGTYTADGKNNTTKVHTGFDFSNTTVAFAVLWKPELAEDTVVIDYGLPVDIDVARNDAVAGAVTGLFDANNAAVLQDVKINEGQISNRVMFATELNTGEENGLKYGKAEVLNNTTVRYTPVNMQMETAEKFYYVSTLNYYEKDTNGNNVLVDSRMYSSVTVIPATTIYYEDEFVTLTTSVKNADGTYTTTSGWDTNSVAANVTQDVDRPGVNEAMSSAYDANNLYGYDSAYTVMSQYSMGNAASVTVNAKKSATAEFEFYGTGFDVISLTDTTTGTIMVDVYAWDSVKKEYASTAVESFVVDTYYGYARVESTDEAGNTVYTWKTVESNSPNALYQVPVMKVSDLTYGKYRVEITAAYASLFDHVTTDEGYKFYLDAIRIYDPCGSENADANEAYTADAEGYPEYTELRNKIIDAEEFNSLSEESNENVSGIVFIDGAASKGAANTASVTDYKNYGPNNELYLTDGQAVAFDLNATASAGNVASVQLAIKTVGGTGSVEVYGVDSAGNKITCLAETISTATDMYYDISDLNGKTVVIKNAGITDTDAAVISLTNIKVTYTEAQTMNNEDDTIPASGGLFSISRSSASNALMTLSLDTEDDTVIEDGTESEDTTEDTETEEPDDDMESEDTTENLKDTVTNIIKNVINTISNWLSEWFR